MNLLRKNWLMWMKFYTRQYNVPKILDRIISRMGGCVNIMGSCVSFQIKGQIFSVLSRIAVVYQSVCCRTIADRLKYNWIAEKKSGQVGLMSDLGQKFLHTTFVLNGSDTQT